MKNKQILIVEDNWQDRALMTLLFESTGYPAINVLNGVQGMREFATKEGQIAAIVIGVPGSAWDLAPFIQRVSGSDARVPVFTKSGDPWNFTEPWRRTSKRLKPLSLVVRVLRAIEGTLTGVPEAKSERKSQSSFGIETNVF